MGKTVGGSKSLVKQFCATGGGSRAKNRSFKRGISPVYFYMNRGDVYGKGRYQPRRGTYRAGQKKKPLADKILEGNPGRRKLMVMEFTDAAELEGESMPPPRDYLAAKQKNGKTTLAVEIYEKTWQWLKERRCVHLIPAQLIEQYAQSVARWIKCEECITEFGFLAKHPTTGNAIPSPYVAMSQSFMKQANNLWYQIYQVVRENCATEYKGATPHDDVMEKLLTARRGG